MKKISVIFLLALFTWSCKKDRACTCTYADGTTYSKATFTNVSRKDAKKLCTNATPGVTCTLD